ncbi:MAG: type I-E CRISPR-associated protein Cas6/Cse3/CasE [Thermodesulfobacteriota bacterium]
MYLSKIEVDMYDARNPYDIHRLIWRLFPGRPDGERPFLYRVEGVKTGSMRLLVQSVVKPEPASDGIRILEGPRTFEPVFHKGSLLRYLLRANPVKKLKEARCRVPLICEEDQRAWLERKLDAAARPVEVQVAQRNTLFFSKGKMTGKIATVTYSGLMEVEDPELLGTLVTSGIGPAKGFGCGLLSLAMA